jgi:hypothetical protein
MVTVSPLSRSVESGVWMCSAQPKRLHYNLCSHLRLDRIYQDFISQILYHGLRSMYLTCIAWMRDYRQCPMEENCVVPHQQRFTRRSPRETSGERNDQSLRRQEAGARRTGRYRIFRCVERSSMNRFPCAKRKGFSGESAHWCRPQLGQKARHCPGMHSGTSKLHIRQGPFGKSLQIISDGPIQSVTRKLTTIPLHILRRYIRSRLVFPSIIDTS